MDPVITPWHAVSSSTSLMTSCGISLALLHFLERLHRAVQSVLVVSSEFGICALQGRISVGFGLEDTVKCVNTCDQHQVDTFDASA